MGCHAFYHGTAGRRNWKADFITAEQVKDKDRSPVTKLRHEFVIEKPVKEAFLIATAQGLYQTFLNGVRIGEDELAPGWTSYHKRLANQTYDVTGQIIQGVNTWGTLVGAGWYKGDISYHRIHNFYGDYAAFSGELIVRYEDGERSPSVPTPHGKERILRLHSLISTTGKSVMPVWKQRGGTSQVLRRTVGVRCR